jgi:hypothetical protein
VFLFIFSFIVVIPSLVEVQEPTKSKKTRRRIRENGLDERCIDLEY